MGIIKNQMDKIPAFSVVAFAEMQAETEGLTAMGKVDTTSGERESFPARDRAHKSRPRHAQYPFQTLHAEPSRTGEDRDTIGTPQLEDGALEYAPKVFRENGCVGHRR